MRVLDRLSLHARDRARRARPAGGLYHFLYIWGPTLATMAAIFIMSSRSDLGGPDELLRYLRELAQRWPQLRIILEPAIVIHRYESWIGHFTFYALLAAALIWGLRQQWPDQGRHYITAWILALLYALTDEWHQSFVPGRTPDVRDILMDALGAALALVLIYLLVRRSDGAATRTTNAHRSDC